MAMTEFGTSDVQTVNLWSKKTLYEALGQTLFFKKFLGETEDSILYWHKDLEKNAGDTIKYDLLVEMTGEGTTGDNKIEDNEEELTYYQDSVVIDQRRHAHIFGRMSQQRTVHDLRQDGQWALSRWWATKWENTMFRYLCGDTTINHGQSGVAADSTHTIYGGDATSEATIGNNDEFTLDLIDYAREKAQTMDQAMRPVRIDGEEYYVLVLHPYSVTDMKLDLGSASLAWGDIQKYANVRGLDNPIFSGAEGVYNKTIIFSSKYIYTPSSNVRRNLFLGAQAGVFAMGNAYDKIEQKKMGNDNLLSWNEETTDAGNRRRLTVGCIYGLKKTRFNSADFGVLTLPCYATSQNS